MNSRVQSLNTASKHFRGSCDVRDIFNWKAGITDGSGSPTRSNQGESKTVQLLCKIQQSFLVGHAEKS